MQAESNGLSAFQIKAMLKEIKKPVQVNFEYNTLALYPQSRRGKGQFQTSLEFFFQVVLQWYSVVLLKLFYVISKIG